MRPWVAAHRFDRLGYRERWPSTEGPAIFSRIYEFNPAVVDIAENQFTYLKDSKALIELVLGDARLSLERELAQGEYASPEQRYDILSVDAFSGSDSGASAHPGGLRNLRARHQPDGIIAFHITNIYLDLAPVVEQIVHDAAFQAVLVADHTDGSRLIMSSDWVLLTRNITLLQQPAIADYSTPIVADLEYRYGPTSSAISIRF